MLHTRSGSKVPRLARYRRPVVAVQPALPDISKPATAAGTARGQSPAYRPDPPLVGTGTTCRETRIFDSLPYTPRVDVYHAPFTTVQDFRPPGAVAVEGDAGVGATEAEAQRRLSKSAVDVAVHWRLPVALQQQLHVATRIPTKEVESLVTERLGRLFAHGCTPAATC